MTMLALAILTGLRSQSQCPTININVTTTNVICRDDSTGSMLIEASGGTAPYQYKITRTGFPGGAWENYQMANIYNNLPWGQYSITTKDANGCTRISTRLLTYKSSGPSITVLKQHATCHNSNTGSIYISVTTGINRVTPYTYNWTGVPSNTPTAPALAAGAYTVRITDSLGCYKDSTITITQPEPLKTTFETNLICVGAANGQITLTANGGIAPYTYNINNGTAWQPSAIFTALTAGNHILKTKDANTCIDSFKVTIPDRNRVNTYVDFTITGNQNVSDTVQINQKCLPNPDSVQWEFPAGAVVVDNNQFAPRLKFNNDGVFKIKMTPWFGDCSLPVEKEFKVKKQHSIFDTALVMPNPNKGRFTLKVLLSRKQPLQVFLRTVTGTLVYYKRYEATREIIETINLDNSGTLPRGAYYLKLLTDNDVRDILVVKQ